MTSFDVLAFVYALFYRSETFSASLFPCHKYFPNFLGRWDQPKLNETKNGKSELPGTFLQGFGHENPLTDHSRNSSWDKTS